MLCTNGHNNNGDAKFCVTCGVNTFTPGTSQAMATTPTSGLAIASLVLGILWVYWIGSILALVFGYVARKEILAGKKQGQGLATAGIVLGWVGVGILIVIILLVVVASQQSNSYY